MRKISTALLLCLLLCLGAIVPLVAEQLRPEPVESLPLYSDNEPLSQESDLTKEGRCAEPPGDDLPLDKEETESQGKTDPTLLLGYISGYGMATENSLDAYGAYLPYSGGELHMELFLRFVGIMEGGVAVMLFLDGQPQPFTLGNGGTTAYQHTVYPDGRHDSILDIFFTPVVGRAGEEVELCILYLPARCAYAIKETCEGSYILKWWDEALFSMVRLKMEQDPPPCQLPEVTDRLAGWNVYNSDASITAGSWWNGSFSSFNSASLFVESQAAVEPLYFDFEAYCNPGKYALTVFVDGEPALYLNWDLEEDAQQIRVDALLDCAGLEGEHTVFAILLEKDYWVDGEGWANYPDANNIKVVQVFTKG